MKFKYCLLCAGNLEKKFTHLLVCQKCGFENYINPKTTTALILVKNEEILLTKRKCSPKIGFWDLPGGFAQPGETAEECLIREVREELGIHLKKLTFFGSYHDNYLYKNILFPTLNFVFVSKFDHQILKPNDDVSAIKFFPKNKIPLKKIAFPFMKQLFKDYLTPGS